MRLVSRSRLLVLLTLVLVAWQSGAADRAAVVDAGSSAVNLHVLAINDFHGGVEERTVSMRPAGGTAALAAYFNERRARYANTVAVHAGDIIGATPPISGLLRDEPSVESLDLLGVEFGAVGNHEFDKGIAALRRLQDGGCDAANNCFPGVRSRYLAANVIEEATGETLFPAYQIRSYGGVRVGFIGAVTEHTPTIVTPSGVAGVRFLDESEAINRSAAELKAMGIRAIIVLLHEGGNGSVNGGNVSGADINRIATALDPEVDLIVSGHSHQGYHGMIGSILVTQAFSNGTAFADIDLDLDPGTGDIVRKRAEIVTAYTDTLAPDPAVAARVAAWREQVQPVVERVVGEAATPHTRTETPAGESTLGNLISNAMLAAMGTQIACVNNGGLRADLNAGPVTYGELATIQPFGNDLVRVTLTGAQLVALLNQQWLDQPFPRIMKCAGLRYTWDPTQPPGARVTLADLRLDDGTPLAADQGYSLAVNNFMADGGDNYHELRNATERVVGPVDLEALVSYVESLPQPFSVGIEGRIQRR